MTPNLGGLVEPLANRLERTLAELPFEVQSIVVKPTDSARLIAVVESQVFADMPDIERQAAVWQHLLDTLPMADRLRIEFVFTEVPGQAA